MVFDKLDLYVDEPDLRLLRLVDVQSSNSDFSDNKPHHIFFKDKTSQPVWCSDPTDGTAISVEQFIGRVRESNATPQDHAQLLLEIINQQQERISKEKEEVKLSDKLAAFADFLYLIEYGE